MKKLKDLFKKKDQKSDVKQLALKPILITSLTAAAAVFINILCEQLFGVSISVEAIIEFITPLFE